jgi:hypothetical protein
LFAIVRFSYSLFVSSRLSPYSAIHWKNQQTMNARHDMFATSSKPKAVDHAKTQTSPSMIFVNLEDVRKSLNRIIGASMTLRQNQRASLRGLQPLALPRFPSCSRHILALSRGSDLHPTRHACLASDLPSSALSDASIE